MSSDDHQDHQDLQGDAMASTTTFLSGTDYAFTAAPRRERPRPPFWRAPFSAFTYREIGFTLTGLPIAIVGFALVITLFSAGLGLAVTVLGLPLLGGMLAVARGLGAFERHRARTLLGLDTEAPARVRPARAGFWGGITARLADAAGWKAALYQVLMFPWAVASFVISVTFLVTGWVVALYPAYHWVFRRYLSWPGYRIYDFTSTSGHHYAYYITSPWQIAGVSLVGICLVLLTPQLVRGLTAVNRLAVRGLLAG